ncbi:MAG: glutathione S-transferase [Candidatus Azotimanducaceae bacterium]
MPNRERGELEQPLWTIGKHRFAIPEKYRHEVMFDTAVWEFEKAQNTLGHRMSNTEFAVGAKFSFADSLLAHTINWAERFGLQVGQRWLEYRATH